MTKRPKGAGTMVNLFYFGRGHTNGDAWVRVPGIAPRPKQVTSVRAKNIPLLDANNGGSGVAIGDTLAKAAKSLKEHRHRPHRAQSRR